MSNEMRHAGNVADVVNEISVLGEISLRHEGNVADVVGLAVGAAAVGVTEGGGTEGGTSRSGPGCAVWSRKAHETTKTGSPAWSAATDRRGRKRLVVAPAIS